MKKQRKPGWMIPAGEKVAMFCGSGSYQFMNTFVQSFLSVYILMVGISPAVAAGVLLVLKAWDAVTDVLVGYFIDKWKIRKGKNPFTKWLFSGRYMPWFRILFLAMPIGTIVLFTISTSLPMWLRIVQYFVGYLLFDFGMSAMSAYNLLPLSTTNNYDERSFILSWNGLGQGIGSLPVILLGTAMIAGSVGYGGAATIFCIAGIILGLIPAVFVKERNAGEFMESEEKKKYTVKEMLQTLKNIPEYLFFLVGVLVSGIFYTSGYGMFVSYYIFDDAMLSIVLTMCSVLPTIVLVPFLPVIFKHVDKIVVARVVCFVFAICGILICVLGADFLKANLPFLYLLSGLQGMCYSLHLFACGQLTVDIVEMAKYRTGTDAGGIISAAYSFVTKLVSSLVTSVTLLILGFYGFVSVEAASFEELAELNAQGIGLQTDRALEGLWNVSYLFPLIGFALAGILYFFVKVRRKDVKVYMQVNSGEISREEGEKLLAQK